MVLGGIDRWGGENANATQFEKIARYIGFERVEAVSLRKKADRAV